MKLNGMAVIKKDKLIGWLTETESIGASFIRDEVESTTVSFPCSDEGQVGMELIRVKTETNGKVQNGKPEIDVMVRTEVNVAEVACSELDLTKNKTIDDLETKTEQAIQSKIEAALNKAQKEYKTDIFGFGDSIHRQELDYWKKVEKDWDQEFADLLVNVTVDAKIRRVGTVGNSFLNELKE